MYWVSLFTYHDNMCFTYFTVLLIMAILWYVMENVSIIILCSIYIIHGHFLCNFRFTKRKQCTLILYTLHTAHTYTHIYSIHIEVLAGSNKEARGNCRSAWHLYKDLLVSVNIMTVPTGMCSTTWLKAVLWLANGCSTWRSAAF